MTRLHVAICAVLAIASVVSVMAPDLRATYYAGGEWYWMLGLSCGCAAASRTGLFGKTGQHAAFKKDKVGGISSYSWTLACGVWMFASAALIIRSTYMCEYIGSEECSFMCSRCLSFNPPCREPNQLSVLLYTRFGLLSGSNITVISFVPLGPSIACPT